MKQAPELPMDLKTRVDVAAGRLPADLVLKNGRIVNVLSCEIHEGDVAIVGDRIAGIGAYTGRQVLDLQGRYICPGFIDGHVHIESSLLSVPEFAKLVAVHGTTAVVADPHEIANVLGTEGIRFMLSSSKYCPIHVYMMASSSVPASRFESSGAELTAIDLLPLFSDRWVLGLAEMMDYPGVVKGDAEPLHKLTVAGQRPIDGHAPGLTGHDLWRVRRDGHRQRPRVYQPRGSPRKAAAGPAHHDPRGQPGAQSRRLAPPGPARYARALHVCHGRYRRG